MATAAFTSVSGGGISIPYGTATDGIEWFFTPTRNSKLTAPPSKILNIQGSSLTVDAGAVVDISGGGDLYAYEFTPGRSGSRDILSQRNSDRFTNNPGGFLYRDGRQVFAIVPDGALSTGTVTLYDPIYSDSYADLTAQTGAGRRVYLNGSDGVSAGWYTLLPAQYATLPGAYRLVERTGVTPPLGVQPGSLFDGTEIISGFFGGLGGTRESAPRLFEVQSRAVWGNIRDSIS